MQRPVVAAAVLVALASCSTVSPPSHYPVFETGEPSHSLAIATLDPGGDLPLPEQCRQAAERVVICGTTPHWFTAELSKVVLGPPLPRRFALATYTHYGQPFGEYRNVERLVLVTHSGNRFAMPTYANEIVARAGGDYVIPVRNEKPIHWLPCAASSLREPVDPLVFLELYRSGTLTAGEDPALYRAHGGVSVPRYGIRVSALVSYLAAYPPRPEGYKCEMRANNSSKPTPLRGAA